MVRAESTKGPVMTEQSCLILLPEQGTQLAALLEKLIIET